MDLNAIGDAKPKTTHSSPASKQATIGGDFNTFLQMLTVQMQNQDPLNPMENSEFAVQLATFSSVEQQVRTNDFLAELVNARSDGASLYTDLIGKNVRAKGNFIHSGSPVSLVLPGNAMADSATVLIAKEDGTLVSTAILSPSDTRFEWSGLLSSGAHASDGAYSAAVRYSSDGDELETVDAEVTNRVVEARFDGQVVQLVLANGVAVSPDDITAISTSNQ